MKRQTRIAVITLGALLILICALLLINRPAIEAGKRAQAESTLTFTRGGETVVTLSAGDIRALPHETFEATIRASGERPTPAVYTGVEIHDLLALAGVTPAEGEELLFRGADMYLTEVGAAELSEYGNIYIVYERDGEAMKNRAQGGEGPYQVIVRSDYYSQRWCKYLSEVEIS